ncbi:unnamed protein product, partial [Polarella glacialis]
IIADSGTMTGEVIPSMSLEYVSFLGEDNNAISARKIHGVPILHAVPVDEQFGSEKLLKA